MTAIPGGTIVTGGSRGIGAAIARAFGAAGSPVAVVYRSAEAEANGVIASIADGGGTAIAVQADITREEDVRALALEVGEKLGEISVIVSGAADPTQRLPFLELTWEDYQRQLDTTVRGLFLLGQSFVPGMSERGAGRIIGLSTTQVDAPLPGRHAYVTAKGALEAMVRALAVELGPTGITANVVVPGLVATERAAALSDEFKAAYIERTPTRRIATPGDVAAAVLYLASAEAANITGTSIRIDGGHH
jgi:3-oxoacyl-[acyl-carrier protein] reductase